jgi:hypothetical protein
MYSYVYSFIQIWQFIEYRYCNQNYYIYPLDNSVREPFNAKTILVVIKKTIQISDERFFLCGFMLHFTTRLSLSLYSLSLCLSIWLSVSVSLSHSLSLSDSVSHTHSVSPSLPHTHTHTRFCLISRPSEVKRPSTDDGLRPSPQSLLPSSFSTKHFNGENNFF